MQLSSDTFNEVVYSLEHHEESLRIKKLIFCICKKYWENDPSILNNVTLNELIQELLRLKPNNDQLTFSVYKLIKTLNRTKVYAPLGKIIIDQISRLYHAQVRESSQEEDTQILTQPVTATAINKSAELVIDQVVANLATHREESRIKKLIFMVCKNQWENNVNIIDSYGLKNLILELRQIYDNKLELRKAFNAVVANINKKNIYLPIANFILSQIEMLYDTEVEYEEENSNKIKTNIIETAIIHLDETQINTSENMTQIYSFENGNVARYQDMATTIVTPDPSPFSRESNLAISHAVVQEQKEYDSFELRLEIMQYTNPLRAKILLFSIVFQPWDQTGQDWSILRGYTLEEMLEQLLQSGKSLNEIEADLYKIAKTQSDLDSYLQTANVISQAIGHIL